ncbi:hypothetical protein AVEN_38916-1 [Araneus ventricosus]|uniref:Uncharacterized protein n=1 Tax=Araneus ventricosus TaxID=182803 RepID=A0A4Y2RXM7_ARAVE|nr:hypothetical protein AVEN_38916-1 [Araneus ventricosus]
MASSEACKLLEETEESSYNSISKSGSSSDPQAEDKKDNLGFTESCAAVLEPSKDESRHSDGRLKNLLRKNYTRSCPQISTHEVPISSSGESNEHEDEQQRNSERQRSNEEQKDEPHRNRCAAFMDCYNTHSRKIRDSWFIYIFQLFASLLSISAIVIGIVFFQSCERDQPSPFPFVTILMGISGLYLIYKWLAKVCRHRRGEHYWNHERKALSFSLAIFLVFLALEIIFFIPMSPKTVQSKLKVTCIKGYYDYLYYMHFAIAGSFVLAASLYLPDFCIYAFTSESPVISQDNGHYQPL